MDANFTRIETAWGDETEYLEWEISEEEANAIQSVTDSINALPVSEEERDKLMDQLQHMVIAIRTQWLDFGANMQLKIMDNVVREHLAAKHPEVPREVMYQLFDAASRGEIPEDDNDISI